MIRNALASCLRLLRRMVYRVCSREVWCEGFSSGLDRFISPVRPVRSPEMGGPNPSDAAGPRSAGFDASGAAFDCRLALSGCRPSGTPRLAAAGSVGPVVRYQPVHVVAPHAVRCLAYWSPGVARRPSTPRPPPGGRVGGRERKKAQRSVRGAVVRTRPHPLTTAGRGRTKVSRSARAGTNRR